MYVHCLPILGTILNIIHAHVSCRNYTFLVYFTFVHQRVLTAEFIDGCKISDVDAIEAMGISLADVSVVLLSCILE